MTATAPIRPDEITTESVVIKPWRRESWELHLEVRGVPATIHAPGSKVFQAVTNPTPLEWRLERELGVSVNLGVPSDLVDEWVAESEEIARPKRGGFTERSSEGRA